MALAEELMWNTRWRGFIHFCSAQLPLSLSTAPVKPAWMVSIGTVHVGYDLHQQSPKKSVALPFSYGCHHHRQLELGKT